VLPFVLPAKSLTINPESFRGCRVADFPDLPIRLAFFALGVRGLSRQSRCGDGGYFAVYPIFHDLSVFVLFVLFVAK
jgi:hypothetical protein